MEIKKYLFKNQNSSQKENIINKMFKRNQKNNIKKDSIFNSLFIMGMYYLAMYYLLFIYYLVDVLFSQINCRMKNSKYQKIVNK